MNIQPINLSPPPAELAQASPGGLRDAAPGAQRATQSSALTPAPVSRPQEAEKQQGVSREQVESAVDEVREFVEGITSNLEFSIDDDTGQRVVKIIDRQTEEVLRQIPSEEMLEIAKALDKLKGLFVQQQA